MSSNNKQPQGGDFSQSVRIKAIEAEILDLTKELEDAEGDHALWEEKFDELEKLEIQLRDLGGGKKNDGWKCDGFSLGCTFLGSHKEVEEHEKECPIYQKGRRKAERRRRRRKTRRRQIRRENRADKRQTEAEARAAWRDSLADLAKEGEKYEASEDRKRRQGKRGVILRGLRQKRLEMDEDEMLREAARVLGKKRGGIRRKRRKSRRKRRRKRRRTRRRKN